MTERGYTPPLSEISDASADYYLPPSEASNLRVERMRNSVEDLVYTATQATHTLGLPLEAIPVVMATMTEGRRRIQERIESFDRYQNEYGAGQPTEDIPHQVLFRDSKVLPHIQDTTTSALQILGLPEASRVEVMQALWGELAKPAEPESIEKMDAYVRKLEDDHEHAESVRKEWYNYNGHYDPDVLVENFRKYYPRKKA